MRKILLTLLFLLLLVTPCFAGSNQNDITQIISDYKDLNNRIHTGIFFGKFQREYLAIQNKVRRFQKENPTSFSSELNNVNYVYRDIYYLWQESFYKRSNDIPDQTTKDLKTRYSGIEKVVNKGFWGGWTTDSTIRALNNIALNEIDLLASSVKISNGPTYGFKYADGLIGGYVFVSQVDQGSVAYNAGLRFGDRIIKINDMPVTTIKAFMKSLDGPEGSQLKLHVLTDDGNVKVIEVIKTKVNQ